jgi:ubiquinone biosynthesis protein COQ9
MSEDIKAPTPLTDAAYQLAKDSARDGDMRGAFAVMHRNALAIERSLIQKKEDFEWLNQKLAASSCYAHSLEIERAEARHMLKELCDRVDDLLVRYDGMPSNDEADMEAISEARKSFVRAALSLRTDLSDLGTSQQGDRDQDNRDSQQGVVGPDDR